MYILPVPKYQLESKCRRELSCKLQCVLQTGNQITITPQIFQTNYIYVAHNKQQQRGNM